jgi:hypothetical protein
MRKPAQKGKHTPMHTPELHSAAITAAAQALHSLAAIAPGLTEAELRIALQLAALQDTAGSTAVSSRNLETRTRVARKNVQRALDSLNHRSLIRTTPGSATRPAVHSLSFTRTAAIPAPAPEPDPDPQGGLWEESVRLGGVTATPPPANGWSHSDATPTELLQGVASQRRHPLEPLPALDIDTSIDLDRSSAQTRETTNPTPPPDSILDRVLTARPQHFQESQLSELRGYAYKWLTMQRRQQDAHPPDLQTVAQLATACGGHVRAIRFIFDNLRDRQAETCQYLVTMALQRLHHIAPPTIKRRREQLKVVTRRQAPAAGSPGEPVQADPTYPEQLTAELVSKVGNMR